MKGKVERFRRTRRAIEAINRGMRGLHDGAWLGFLDPPDLNEVTSDHYSAASSIYREERYNLSGLFPWEELVLDRFFADCRSVLVAATGGGREVLGLARRGLRVDAFECNPALYAKASELVQSAGLAARMMPAAPDELPIGVGTYDGAVVGYGAYPHIIGRGARIRFLAGIRSCLRPGAPIIVSFHLRGKSRRDRIAWRVASTIRSIRGAEPPAEVGDTLFERFEHWFTREELEGELAEAGLEVVYFDTTPMCHAVARVADQRAKD